MLFNMLCAFVAGAGFMAISIHDSALVRANYWPWFPLLGVLAIIVCTAVNVVRESVRQRPYHY